MPAPPPRPAAFSFELFPPKTPEGMTKLAASIDLMNAVGPEYFSVTYGAGGSTRDSTFAALDLLLARGIPAAPHLACIGSSRAEIRAILERYQGQGIRRLEALGVDLAAIRGVGHEIGRASGMESVSLSR